MEEKRIIKRSARYLNVIEQTSGDLIGHVGDIHYSGLMLVSKFGIPLLMDISVWVEVPGDRGIKSRVPLIINDIWNQKNTKPVFYHTGCRIVDPSHQTIRDIDELIGELTS